MKYCTVCGYQLEDSYSFCTKCGSRQNSTVNNAAGPQFQAQPDYNQQYTNYQNPGNAAPMPGTVRDFSRIKVRYRCMNGHVFNGSEDQFFCPTCNAPLPKDGYIQLYRMGNFAGCAVGMGIYLNEMPFGHIGNKESIRISLPFGSYKMHVTHTSTRSCNDPIVTITPQIPVVYVKAHFAAAGFKIRIEPANHEDMPTA